MMNLNITNPYSYYRILRTIHKNGKSWMKAHWNKFGLILEQMKLKMRSWKKIVLVLWDQLQEFVRFFNYNRTNIICIISFHLWFHVLPHPSWLQFFYCSQIYTASPHCRFYLMCSCWGHCKFRQIYKLLLW